MLVVEPGYRSTLVEDDLSSSILFVLSCVEEGGERVREVRRSVACSARGVRCVTRA